MRPLNHKGKWLQFIVKKNDGLVTIFPVGSATMLASRDYTIWYKCTGIHLNESEVKPIEMREVNP